MVRIADIDDYTTAHKLRTLVKSKRKLLRSKVFARIVCIFTVTVSHSLTILMW